MTTAAPLWERLAQANQLDRAGRRDEAMAAYAGILADVPDSSDAHYVMGRVLDLVGQYEQARSHFMRALELAHEGGKDQVMRMLAISWIFAGDVREASRSFAAVFERSVASSQVAAAADVASELGRVHLETGSLDEAEAWYGKSYDCAQSAPDTADWQVDLNDLRWAHAKARLAARRGDAGTAWQQVAIVRALLDKGTNPDHEPQYAYLRGYVAFHLGDDLTAIDELGRADRKDPFIQLLLAQASERLGRTEEALEHYRQVLESHSHGTGAALARLGARDSHVSRKP